MGMTRANADAILKEQYEPPLREQLNLSTAYLAQLEKNTDSIVGRRIVMPLHVGRSEAVGSRGEGGTLPVAGNQQYVDAVWLPAYHYGVISVTGPVIESTKSDEGAFVRAVDSETKGIMKELREDVNRQIIRNDTSGNGLLATFATNASSTTLNLQGADVTTARIIRPGQVIDLYTGSTNNGTRTIQSVTTSGTPPVATAIVVDTAIATTAGDVAYRTATKSNEMFGLAGIVANSGVLQGVDPATYPVWKASVFSNSGTPRALSEDLMEQTADLVSATAGEDIGVIVSEYTQQRKFYALLQSMKRSVDKTELKGGYTALTFNDNIPVIVDRMVPPDRMYFLNMDHLAMYEMTDWAWADRDGAILSRVPNQDLWTAFLYKYANTGTDMRNSHGLLSDLQT